MGARHGAARRRRQLGDAVSGDHHRPARLASIRLVLVGVGVAAVAALLVDRSPGRAGDCRDVPVAPSAARAAGLASPSPAGPPSERRLDESAAPSQATTAATAHATPPALAVGDRFRFGPWAVVVEEVETAEEVPAFGGMTATGTFLVVRLAVANEGSCPALFPYRATRVVDGAGRVHPLDPFATDFSLRTDGPDTVDGTGDAIASGAAVRTVLVFDVPPDAAGFTLAVGDGAIAVALGR